MRALMTQLGPGLDLSTKRMRKRGLIDEMGRVVLWTREPHYPTGKTGRPCLDAILDPIAGLKSGIRAKVGHLFRILKQQFGYPKTRYQALLKNTAWLASRRN